MLLRTLLICGLLAALSSCYEQRSGCLDPDASNYDLQADEACADCCTFPELSVRVTTFWEDEALVIGDTYVDGAGNDFQFVRFRYYLGGLRLESTATDLSDPVRPVDIRELTTAGDTSDVISVAGNYLLASTATSTATIGAIATNGAPLTALSGTFGLDDRYRCLLPATAPTGDALRTQPGLLNFRDGAGYVQSRLEYTLEAGDDTLSVSSYGSVPFRLDFGQEVFPERGFDLRVDVQARLVDLVGSIDLTADSASVAAGLGSGADFLTVTGLAQ